MELLRQPVKGIFFDLGWTLVYPPSGDWEFTQPAQKLFNWEVYQSLPKERTAAVRKEANDYLEAHHHISSLEEEYDRMLQYFTIVAQKLPELGATRQDIEAAALEKVYQSQHTYNLMEDAIPTLEALKAVTTYAAYQYFEEERKGSLAAGKAADFVILGQDPLTADPMALRDIPVLETIKDGRTIWPG